MKKIIIILSLILLISCGEKTISDSSFIFGTNCEITIYDKDKSLLLECFNFLRDIENKISVNIENSEISIINKNAGIKAVEVSQEVYDLIEYSIRLSILTKGVFNPLLGELIALYDIGGENQRVPSDNEIENALKNIDVDNIILKDNTVYLKSSNSSLNLGAVGKGYASYKIAEFLSSKGVKEAIINLGGSIYILSDESVNVGLQHPLNNQGEYFFVVKAQNEAIVTSGSYEKYFIEDGVKYHHIFDPKNGKPAKSDLLSVSIIDEDGTLCDVFSTAIFILGEKKGVELLESLGIKAVLLNDKEEIIKL